MFDFGFGEMIGLVVLALILVGPERMPRVAGDLAKMIKKVRSLTNSATAEIRDNLGPGFEDLKPADLNPKTFIKRQVASVLEDEDEKNARENKADLHSNLKLIQIYYDNY
jgi:sec-independent protein translocase protein TatB